MAISENSTIQRTSGHFRVEHEGATIIMSLAAGKYFTFDPIGFEIWEGIASPVQVSSLCSELAAVHKAPLETVMTDVVEFLDKLKAQDLISIS